MNARDATVLAFAAAATAFYFTWRIGAVDATEPLYAWSIVAAEGLGLARTAIFLVSSARPPRRDPAPPAPAGLSVDVFVPSYDEPYETVRRTLLAARAIRYPHETWLLDDGERPAMEELAASLGVRYLARREHADAKAGNLNHALAQARGAFVVVLDADHVASPHFLDRTLGYFHDPQLAFVQTPHAFYNTDSFEHLDARRGDDTGASFFHHVVQSARGASGTTIYCGSSAVLRRSALEAVGGFAAATVSEDVDTSLRLHAAGWNSLFHPETLTAGMGPLDGAAYRAQRRRWAIDSLQVLVRENVAFRRDLPFGRRMTYLVHVASNLDGVRHAVIYALPIVMLVSGNVPLTASAPAFLAHWIPYFVALTLAVRVFSRGYGGLLSSAVYNLARTPAAIAAAFAWHRERRFNVTPKTRARVTPAYDGFTLGLVVASVAAIVYAIAAKRMGSSSLGAGALTVLATWAGYHVLVALRLLALERRCSRAATAPIGFDPAIARALGLRPGSVDPDVPDRV